MAAPWRRPAPLFEGAQMTGPATGTSELFGRASRLRSTPLCRNTYQNLGHVGKRNLKIVLDRFRQWIGLTACGLLIFLWAGGCRADLGEYLQSGRVLPLQGLEGRWVGQVVPTESGCGPATQGLMSIGGTGFGLDPFQSTTIIRGEVGDDGRLVGRLVRHGPDHHDLSIAFEGSATGSAAISGTLQSGRCRWTVTLRRG